MWGLPPTTVNSLHNNILPQSTNGDIFSEDGIRQPMWQGNKKIKKNPTSGLITLWNAFFYNNNNNSYVALYPVKIYKLAALYIINIKIDLTIKKTQVL